MKVSALLETVSIAPPVLVSPNDPLITAGAMLSWRNVTSVVVMQGKDVVGALYGYQLLLFLVQPESNRVYKDLFLPIGNTRRITSVESIPKVQPDDDLSLALERITEKRFGDVLVMDRDAQPIGVLSIVDVMRSCERMVRRVGARVASMASSLKLVNDQMSLRDLILFLFQNRIRRIVLNKGGFYHADERALLKYVFSPARLQSLQKDTDAFLKFPISDFAKEMTVPLAKVRENADVTTAWKMALAEGQDCVLVDKNKIATPWDLVIKPFVEGKLRV